MFLKIVDEIRKLLSHRRSPRNQHRHPVRQYHHLPITRLWWICKIWGTYCRFQHNRPLQMFLLQCQIPILLFCQDEIIKTFTLKNLQSKNFPIEKLWQYFSFSNQKLKNFFVNSKFLTKFTKKQKKSTMQVP